MEGYITPHRDIITATEFSNVSLHCSALSWTTQCWFSPVKLSWHYISKNKTLQNSTKYTIRQHHIKNECGGRRLEAEFSLDIINVTHEDDGIYICQMSCPYRPNPGKGAIELRTVARAQPNGTIGNIFSYSVS